MSRQNVNENNQEYLTEFDHWINPERFIDMLDPGYRPVPAAEFQGRNTPIDKGVQLTRLFTSLSKAFNQYDPKLATEMGECNKLLKGYQILNKNLQKYDNKEEVLSHAAAEYAITQGLRNSIIAAGLRSPNPKAKGLAIGYWFLTRPIVKELAKAGCILDTLPEQNRDFRYYLGRALIPRVTSETLYGLCTCIEKTEQWIADKCADELHSYFSEQQKISEVQKKFGIHVHNMGLNFSVFEKLYQSFGRNKQPGYPEEVKANSNLRNAETNLPQGSNSAKKRQEEWDQLTSEYNSEVKDIDGKPRLVSSFLLDTEELREILNDPSLADIEADNPNTSENDQTNVNSGHSQRVRNFKIKDPNPPSLMNDLNIENIKIGEIPTGGVGPVISTKDGAVIGMGIEAGTGALAVKVAIEVPLGKGFLLALGEAAIWAAPAAVVIATAYILYKKHKRTIGRLNANIGNTHADLEFSNDAIKSALEYISSDQAASEEFINKLNGIANFNLNKADKSDCRGEYAASKKKYDSVYYYFVTSNNFRQASLDARQMAQDQKMLDNLLESFEGYRDASIGSLVDQLKIVCDKEVISKEENIKAQFLKSAIQEKLNGGISIEDLDSLKDLENLNLKDAIEIKSIARPKVPSKKCFKKGKKDRKSAKKCIDELFNHYDNLKKVCRGEITDQTIEHAYKRFITVYNKIISKLNGVELKKGSLNISGMDEIKYASHLFGNTMRKMELEAKKSIEPAQASKLFTPETIRNYRIAVCVNTFFSSNSILDDKGADSEQKQTAYEERYEAAKELLSCKLTDEDFPALEEDSNAPETKEEISNREIIETTANHYISIYERYEDYELYQGILNFQQQLNDAKTPEDFLKVEEILLNFREKFPENREGIDGLANCYLRQGKYQKLKDHVQNTILNQNPDDEFGITMEGIAEFSLGNTEAARQRFSKLLKEDSENETAKDMLGKIDLKNMKTWMQTGEVAVILLSQLAKYVVGKNHVDEHGELTPTGVQRLQQIEHIHMSALSGFQVGTQYYARSLDALLKTEAESLSATGLAWARYALLSIKAIRGVVGLFTTEASEGGPLDERNKMKVFDQYILPISQLIISAGHIIVTPDNLISGFLSFAPEMALKIPDVREALKNPHPEGTLPYVRFAFGNFLSELSETNTFSAVTQTLGSVSYYSEPMGQWVEWGAEKELVKESLKWLLSTGFGKLLEKALSLLGDGYDKLKKVLGAIWEYMPDGNVKTKVAEIAAFFPPLVWAYLLLRLSQLLIAACKTLYTLSEDWKEYVEGFIRSSMLSGYLFANNGQKVQASHIFRDVKKTLRSIGIENKLSRRVYVQALMLENIMAKKYIKISIKQDHNALFSAVSIYTDKTAEALRALTIRYMLSNQQAFNRKIRGNFKSYLEQLKKNERPGGFIEIQALSLALGRPIVDVGGHFSFNDNLTGEPIFVNCQLQFQCAKATYHGFIVEEDYVLLKHNVKIMKALEDSISAEKEKNQAIIDSDVIETKAAALEAEIDRLLGRAPSGENTAPPRPDVFGERRKAANLHQRHLGNSNPPAKNFNVEFN